MPATLFSEQDMITMKIVIIGSVHVHAGWFWAFASVNASFGQFSLTVFILSISPTNFCPEGTSLSTVSVGKNDVVCMCEKTLGSWALVLIFFEAVFSKATKGVRKVWTSNACRQEMTESYHLLSSNFKRFIHPSVVICSRGIFIHKRLNLHWELFCLASH